MSEGSALAHEVRPPAEHEGKVWHWVGDDRSPPMLWLWDACSDKWTEPLNGGEATGPERMHMFQVRLPSEVYGDGFRYFGPAEWNPFSPFPPLMVAERQSDGTMRMKRMAECQAPGDSEALLSRIAELEAENDRHMATYRALTQQLTDALNVLTRLDPSCALVPEYGPDLVLKRSADEVVTEWEERGRRLLLLRGPWKRQFATGWENGGWVGIDLAAERPTALSAMPVGRGRCRYCEAEFMTEVLPQHEAVCDLRPRVEEV